MLSLLNFLDIVLLIQNMGRNNITTRRLMLYFLSLQLGPCCCVLLVLIPCGFGQTNVSAEVGRKAQTKGPSVCNKGKTRVLLKKKYAKRDYTESLKINENLENTKKY